VISPLLGLSIVPDCSFLSPASWATARSRRNTLEPPKERVVAFMQREHVRTHSRSGGQRQRIPVGPHAESHARTGDEEPWQSARIPNVRYSWD
jgi:hypothetical protein